MLCGDDRDDVATAAADGVTILLAGRQDDRLRNIVVQLAASHQDRRILGAVLALPSADLEVAREQLLALLASPSPWVRKRMLGALATGDWLPDDAAKTAAGAALADPDPSVQSRAALTLRTLEQRGE